MSLPGPGSSKVGIIIGTMRAGLPGGVLAWLGFTAPSAMALILFAYGVQQFAPEGTGWLHGLKIAAVSVVALALFFALLFGLPVVRQVAGGGQALATVDSFYRTGSLVFGGGHVVLPLLRLK
jgi:chromate transporter